MGRTFLREEEVYRFNLVPDAGHKRPGMINLQQYHLEEALVHRAEALGVDLRWKYKVVGVEPLADGARVSIETPDGNFEIDADWLIVADGARSNVRRQLGLDIEGHVFKDRFLIADVIMKPTSRPSAGSGSTRRSIPTRACCCTSRATTSGASTSSSAGTPIRKKRRSPRTSFHASRPCWAMSASSSWNGPASTPSSAGA
ncbi:FAD-dependent oxidoreductase [Hydrogenophaga sp. T4]|nr:FAD-dependent oxidoreductase [Hydrogenophaga sp. T4]